MFNQSNRYVTRGINEKIDVRLQLIMWSLIDELNESMKNKVDYLQVFRLNKFNDCIRIEHTQEIPKYKEIYTVKIEDIEFNNEKIFVRDSGSYSTMLLAEEY